MYPPIIENYIEPIPSTFNDFIIISDTEVSDNNCQYLSIIDFLYNEFIMFNKFYFIDELTDYSVNQ